MSEQTANRGGRGPHPLTALLQAIREKHKMSQLKVELCMELPVNTLRHLEKGRRSLPHLEHGLAAWVKRFLDCVKADPDERKQVLEVMSRQVLTDLSELLDDM